MKWFKHETERSAKVDRLLMEYGVEGYGLYQYCREIIAGTIRPENLTFELEHDAELIAYQLKMDTLKVEKIMHRCIELGLFELADSGHLSCFSLAESLDNTMSQNPGVRKIQDSLKETLSNFKGLKADKKRIEKNRREEVITPPTPQGDAAAMAPEKARTFEEALKPQSPVYTSLPGEIPNLYEKSKTWWNSFPWLPRERMLYPNANLDPEAISNFDALSEIEILDSITNYATVYKCQEAMFRHRSFRAFMKHATKYTDDADPHAFLETTELFKATIKEAYEIFEKLKDGLNG